MAIGVPMGAPGVSEASAPSPKTETRLVNRRGNCRLFDGGFCRRHHDRHGVLDCCDGGQRLERRLFDGAGGALHDRVGRLGGDDLGGEAVHTAHVDSAWLWHVPGGGPGFRQACSRAQRTTSSRPARGSQARRPRFPLVLGSASSTSAAPAFFCEVTFLLVRAPPVVTAIPRSAARVKDDNRELALDVNAVNDGVWVSRAASGVGEDSRCVGSRCIWRLGRIQAGIRVGGRGWLGSRWIRFGWAGPRNSLPHSDRGANSEGHS